MYHFEKFADYVSGLLKMIPPNVVFVPHDNMINRYGENVLAQYDGDEGVIYVELKDEYEMQDYYDLAYSIRLIWQEIFGIEFDSEIYKFKSNITMKEIDAHAFAYIAMGIRFGKHTKTTFNSDDVAQKALQERIDALSEEYGIEIKPANQ